MSDSPTGGLSPLMDMRCKLTKAEKEIERLRGALTQIASDSEYYREDGANILAEIAHEALKQEDECEHPAHMVTRTACGDYCECGETLADFTGSNEMGG